MRPFVFLFLLAAPALAIDPYPRNNNIDVQHYRFELELNDSTDVIEGKATISILFKNPISSFALDLVNRSTNGKGMTIITVRMQDKAIVYSHQNDRLTIPLTTAPNAGTVATFEIRYRGIPQDGLIISKNKFGDRTFFGDNWPDRGHQWLPVIDHPSDKAPVEFLITAPEPYQVVATGKQVEETNLPKRRKLTHWKETTEVPVKVMTIGVARFAVQLSGEPGTVPVSTWVYPQNRDDGFHDFAVAPQVLSFFQEYVGPFSFQKLAHVQSKTRFGGLENAGAIFYFENSVNGKNEREGLIAHETAHQWFGNSVTENDWHHVWLSEGFATYFAALYFEKTYGRDRFVSEMIGSRESVLAFYAKNQAPIVDTTITDINRVLSTNTYQKAGWVLHMLRQEIGDEAFQATIREFYDRFRKKNAMTRDFQAVAEKNAGKSLTTFFQQWLWRGGHPNLQATWQYDAQKGELAVECTQTQKEQPFLCSLELGIQTAKGMEVRTIGLSERKSRAVLKLAEKPTKIVLDPQVKLLFAGKIGQK